MHAVGTGFGKEGVGYNGLLLQFLVQNFMLNPFLVLSERELPPLGRKIDFFTFYVAHFIFQPKSVILIKI